jgi:hypothetical protein
MSVMSRMLRDSSLGPEKIERLELAYSRALRAMHLVDRDDPIAEMIARKIIQIEATGVHEPTRISRIAIKQLGSPIDRRAIRAASAQE